MVLGPKQFTWLPLIPTGGVSFAVTATFPGLCVCVCVCVCVGGAFITEIDDRIFTFWRLFKSSSN